MKIRIIAFDECLTSAAYGLMDALNIAGLIAARAGGNAWAAHEVRLVTPSGRPVRGFGGFTLTPEGALSDLDADMAIVAPILGDVPQALERERELVDALAALDRRAAVLASVCTGAFFLAEAGVLRGRRITTNPAYGAAFRARYPDVELALDDKLVADRRVICAGSTTAFLDLAVHIVDRLGGHDLALATAKALSMDARPGSQRAYHFFVAPRDHGDSGVLQIQDWLEDRHSDDLNIGDLARAGGMSRRSLNRRFLVATGLTPAEYLREVRVERAKRLLETGSLTTDQIADAIGYGEARAFGRAFRAAVGCAPGEYRRRFRLRSDGTLVGD